MKLYSLKIGNKPFKVAVISDAEEMKKGLSGKPRMASGKGLFFNFKNSQEVTMNMRDMNYPLDMIFIDKDRNVKTVKSLEPGDNQVTVPDVLYVLEVNKGEGKKLEGESVSFSRCIAELLGYTIVKKDEKIIEEDNNIIVSISKVPKKEKNIFQSGGKFKLIEEDVKVDKDAMQVLDDKGTVLMNIMGGERIFSIKHTEQLISLAKKIDRGEADEKELGELMSKILDIQNTQEPEYV